VDLGRAHPLAIDPVWVRSLVAYPATTMVGGDVWMGLVGPWMGLSGLSMDFYLFLFDLPRWQQTAMEKVTLTVTFDPRRLQKPPL